MPISEKQLAANRANAVKSRGAKTPGGKYNSSRNAITHGFLAKSIVIPGESQKNFLQLLSTLVNEFQPIGAYELDLVETMAIARWRTSRAVILETASLAWEQRNQADSTTEEDGPTRAMLAHRSLADGPYNPETLSRYEIRFDRQYHRAADRLLRLKAQRKIDSTPFLEANKGITE